MGLKPTRARWFEVLVTREHLSRVVETLAATGIVQFEPHESAEQPLGLENLRAKLAEFDGMARRYTPHWPEQARAPLVPGIPLQVLDFTLERLRRWVGEADPVIARLETLEHEQLNLQLLCELYTTSGERLPGASVMARTGQVLRSGVFVAPADARLPPLPGRAICQRFRGPENDFFVALCPESDAALLESALEAVKARRLELPDWLEGPSTSSVAKIQTRSAELGAALSETRDALNRLHAAYDLAAALGEFRRLRWYLENVPSVPHTRVFALVRGWTSDQSDVLLAEALRTCGVHTLIDFPRPPEDSDAPLILENRSWVKPFELFARLLGTPAHDEADPSVPLALITPLLFGFMFADVGQGMLLTAGGILLRRRLPALRLLIPGGVAAMFFGLVFGSVFGREDLIAPLWMHPLDDPVMLLLVSLVAGAAILTLGLLLTGIAAHWGDQLGRWLSTDAALLLIYVGLLGLAIDVKFGWLAVTGVLWHLVGSAAAASEKRVRATFIAAGHLLERVVQLGVNTISFARVGAFALAHAGLSSAIHGLTMAAESAVAVVLITMAGNAFAVLVEGLVIGIQTTRLVLFEFFVRFFRAEGRAFRPLSPPPALGSNALEGT